MHFLLQDYDPAFSRFSLRSLLSPCGKFWHSILPTWLPAIHCSRLSFSLSGASESVAALHCPPRKIRLIKAMPQNDLSIRVIQLFISILFEPCAVYSLTNAVNACGNLKISLGCPLLIRLAQLWSYWAMQFISRKRLACFQHGPSPKLSLFMLSSG